MGHASAPMPPMPARPWQGPRNWGNLYDLHCCMLCKRTHKQWLFLAVGVWVPFFQCWSCLQIWFNLDWSGWATWSYVCDVEAWKLQSWGSIFNETSIEWFMNVWENELCLLQYCLFLFATLKAWALRSCLKQLHFALINMQCRSIDLQLIYSILFYLECKW